MQDITIEGALNELLYSLIIDQLILKVPPIRIILKSEILVRQSLLYLLGWHNYLLNCLLVLHYWW